LGFARAQTRRDEKEEAEALDTEDGDNDADIRDSLFDFTVRSFVPRRWYLIGKGFETMTYGDKQRRQGKNELAFDRSREHSLRVER
jgi:hypothetical protein